VVGFFLTGCDIGLFAGLDADANVGGLERT